MIPFNHLEFVNDPENVDKVSFRELLDKLPFALYITDANGCLTYYNQEAVELSGRVPNLGTDQWCITWKLYNPDGTPLPHEKCPMAIALKEKRPIVGGEVILERPDGKRIWVTPYPIPLCDVDGKLIGGFNILQDISYRKSLDHSDTLLSAIINNSDDAIISKNPSGVITSWNPGAEKMFGYAANEIVGKPITLLVPEDLHEEEMIILDELNRGKRVHHFETIRLRKDGTSLHVSLTLSPIYDHAGKIAGASKIVRDITDRKITENNNKKLNDLLFEERVREQTEELIAYQEQLRALTLKLNRSNYKEKLHLAAGLHNNLGQILALGKMNIDLLLSDPLPDKKQTYLLDLSELMNSAISYTRQLMTDLKPPPSLDEESLMMTISWIANKMKKFDLDVTIKQDTKVKAVPEEVSRILSHCVRELLFNVIEHAEVKKAHIILSRNDNGIQVTVEDKGKGFNPGELTLHSKQNDSFGLFSINEQVKWLNGTVEIDSSPGKGTKVTITIPLKMQLMRDNTSEAVKADAGSAGNPPVVAPEKYPSKSIIRILLVDDHEMMRKGLRSLLEKQKDLVVTGEANNGREAIDLAKKMNPDIIVMDVNMPLMDGIEATIAIKSDQKLKARIIGLSLHDKEDVKQSMLKAGASAYVTKTEAIESLASIIRKQAGIGK